MERKTKIHAEDNKQELFITREFDLPLNLLFTAYTEPQLVEQWMGTKVLKLENKKHGSYRFETTDPKGNKHCFSGVIHDFSREHRITRTFEMENTNFDAWLEFLEFEAAAEGKSKLTIQVIYRSLQQRNDHLKMPFAQGIDWAHNRLQDIAGQLIAAQNGKA